MDSGNEPEEMMDERQYSRLLEASWRRPLTAEEAASVECWLQAHPGERPNWELEAALSKALTVLPDVPLSSNFTARTISAAERPIAAGQRQSGWRGFAWMWGRGWLPRVAFAALVLGVAVFSYREVEQVNRAKMIQGVAAVSEVASVPEPELLSDFDAIRVLNPQPAADEELLRILQ